MEPLFITSAQVAGQLRLQLTFSDGKSQTVDFSGFLLSSHNPHIRKYADEKLFETFRITNGDLEWNDYDLCFPVIDLYENRIARNSDSAAA